LLIELSVSYSCSIPEGRLHLPQEGNMTQRNDKERQGERYEESKKETKQTKQNYKNK
jgi:hypothetical protein